MTYRQSGFEPGHVEPKEPDARPYDGWQKLGLLAFAAGLLVIAFDLAGFLGLAGGRDYPGTLILLAGGGSVLLGYRSKGGLLASRSPEWRRNFGVALTLPGLFLAGLELAA